MRCVREDKDDRTVSGGKLASQRKVLNVCTSYIDGHTVTGGGLTSQGRESPKRVCTSNTATKLRGHYNKY